MRDVKGVKSGTTTVGIVCRDGVVLAAERKATMGYLVASKEDTKITKIMDHIAITQAGMVGDIQALTRYITAEANLFELRNKKKIPLSAANWLKAPVLAPKSQSIFGWS